MSDLEEARFQNARHDLDRRQEWESNALEGQKRSELHDLERQMERDGLDVDEQERMTEEMEAKYWKMEQDLQQKHSDEAEALER